MGKEEILSYVMNSPENTNPNVLGSMLDSLGGGIEMITLFDDDDINSEYIASQYGPAYGRVYINIPVDTVDAGFILVTYEGDHYFGVISNYHQLSVQDGLPNSELPFVSISLAPYSFEDKNYMFSIQSNESSSPELEAYCQEPHHLKVEWFII